MSDAILDLDDAARAEAGGGRSSILLEAPAGSGKTAVLIHRFLRLLAVVDDPGEILAITFTRKAAAEMRARIVRALRGDFAAGDPEAERLRPLARAALTRSATRGWQIETEPQTLRIQTIDSFDYWLATQLPVASRAGGVLNITESAGELYRRAARRTLGDGESDPELAPDVALLFARYDNHWIKLERLIAQMLAQRGHWLRFVAGENPQVLCRRVNASLSGLARGQLMALGALITPALRRRAEALVKLGPLGTEPSDLPRWKRFQQLVVTRDGWRKQLSARLLGPEYADPAERQRLRDLIADLGTVEGACEALLDLRRLPGAQLPEDDATAIAALSRVLSRAVAELHAEFAAAQRVDYTYITGAARQALTEDSLPTDLALRTGLALRHILVDEFQDTSLAQFRLLEALTVGWEEGDGRTLFVVGDAMQSIYRFRDAEVGLFLRARTAGIGRVGLRARRLTRNFRAAPELVAFTNEVFSEVFPAADDRVAGGVSYRDCVAARGRPVAAPPGVPPLSLRLFPDDRAAEARALAARVAVLRRADPDGTVAVLVVAHAHAVAVIDALEAEGLRSLGVDLVPLRERLIVRDLVQLIRALYDLADRAAWLAVLRAPWCGARLTTLTALSRHNDRELIIEALSNPRRLARCDPADRPRLERVRAILSEALDARGAAPAADWLERTWLRLGASDAYGAGELADARTFFAALAERAAAFEWEGPRDFGSLLQNLFSAPPAGNNPVQVMTIHRAKGLEFDHVLVPALDRPTRTSERQLLRWIDLSGEEEESGLLMAPAPPAGVWGEGTLDDYLRILLRCREEHERARLMYVAATRARRTLWLSGAPATSADSTVKCNRRSSLALLWPVLALRFEAAGHDKRAPATAAAADAVPLTRLRAGWQPAPPPAGVPVTQLPGAYLATEPPEFSWVGETQRHIGTVVHAWLTRLARAAELPSQDAIAAEGAAVLGQLGRLGVAGREQSRALQRVLEAIRRTLEEPSGRWILDARHTEAHSEWELSGIAGGRLRNVKIDRSFVDEEGTRWVIDYKTSSHEGGDLEAFLTQEIERYRAQLEGYRSLAAAAGPEPVRAALYFPLLGAFRELR